MRQGPVPFSVRSFCPGVGVAHPFSVVQPELVFDCLRWDGSFGSLAEALRCHLGFECEAVVLFVDGDVLDVSGEEGRVAGEVLLHAELTCGHIFLQLLGKLFAGGIGWSGIDERALLEPRDVDGETTGMNGSEVNHAHFVDDVVVDLAEGPSREG